MGEVKEGGRAVVNILCQHQATGPQNFIRRSLWIDSLGSCCLAKRLQCVQIRTNHDS